MNCIITLDIGTTSVKACIFDDHLSLLAFSKQEYELLTPENGIVELSADIYWDAVVAGIRKVLGKSNVKTHEIKVITCTTQGETLIPVDREGNDLHNAIVWLDGRAIKEAEFINKRFSKQDIFSITGLPEISASCPVSKVLWLKNNRPDIYDNTYKILLLEDYLILRLTGVFVTNPSLTCSTGYFDINKNSLWNDILNYCGLDADKFPDLMDCGKFVAVLSKSAAFELGLSESTAVSTGAMDQAASAIGAGNIEEGIVTETTGTALVVAAACDHFHFIKHLNITVYRHAIRDKFLLLSISQTAGILLKWFKDEFCSDLAAIAEEKGISIYEEMDKIAAEACPLSNGLILFPHFAGMLIPEMNPRTRGIFFGIGLDTSKKHFIRAILESVDYMLRENITALQAMGINIQKVYSLGGGSNSSLWLQIKADINDMAFVSMELEESTSLGAAILGGMSVGIFNDLKTACQLIKAKNMVIPNKENITNYNQAYSKYQRVYNSLKDVF